MSSRILNASLPSASPGLEDWSLGDGVYFSFVTGLTIGYGDLVPRRALSRFLAILIGILGTLLTALSRCHRGQSPANGGGAMMLEARGGPH